MLFLAILINLAFTGRVAAQNFSTKGVEFWAAYAPHVNMYTKDGSPRVDGGSQKMIFYFLANKRTSVTVEIPSVGWVKKYKVTANTVAESDEMPKLGANDVRLLSEGLSGKGIHITSDERITVYCHIYDFQSSATTMLLPVNLLGQEYYTLNYTQRSDKKFARSYCFVIAAEDNTTVEIIPAANTLTHTARVPFIQKLNKGEVFNLLGKTSVKEGHSFIGSDLTGTYIHTVNQSGTEACKKIIVFSGSSSVNIMCNDDVNNSSDNLIQQIPSLEGWGNYFITVPTLKMPVNKYRAMVLYPNQKVYVNNKRLTNLQKGRFYEFQTDKACIVSSDSLVLLAQYITTAGKCGNAELGNLGGDPEMIYITPIGNGINKVMFNATTHNEINAHYVNILMKVRDIDSVKLDDDLIAERFITFDRNPDYAIAQIQVSPGRHILQADSSFQAYAYGYGKKESYGYNTGFSINHTTGQLGLRTLYENPAAQSTCTAAPFQFYFDVEAQLFDIEWKFNNNIHLKPNKDIHVQQPKPDSIYKSGTTFFYRYYLPGLYQYSATGQLPVDIIASLADAKGCISKKVFSQAVKVLPNPVAKWTVQYDKCTNKTLSFTDSSLIYNNNGATKWSWDFGDGTTSDKKNPQQQFGDFGEYKIQLQVIDGMGCRDDTSQVISLYHKPVATFDISGSVCSGENVLFKSTAAVDNDALAQLRWVFKDGTTSQAQTVVKQFAGNADYEVKLIAKSNHGCIDTIIKTVHIYEKPEISLPAVLYVFEGDTLRLKPNYKGSIKKYNWAPAINLSASTAAYPLAIPTNDINYTITVVTDGPCEAFATTVVKLQRKLDVPNAFSPNSDGINDTWHIKNIKDYTACTVEIFNRWGSRVFYSRGYSNDWDGRLNGSSLPVGTYYYIINTNSVLKNNVLSGSLTILK